VKEELADLQTPEIIKKVWEGVVRNITVEEFTVAFGWWLD
jgi:hypothetical protein